MLISRVYLGQSKGGGGVAFVMGNPVGEGEPSFVTKFSCNKWENDHVELVVVANPVCVNRFF